MDTSKRKLAVCRSFDFFFEKVLAYWSSVDVLRPFVRCAAAGEDWFLHCCMVLWLGVMEAFLGHTTRLESEECVLPANLSRRSEM